MIDDDDRVNHPPVLKSFEPIVLEEGVENHVLYLDDFFADPDENMGDTLTFVLVSYDNYNLGEPSLDGNTLEILFQAGATGAATVVVRALDSQGQYVDAEIKIEVQSAVPTIKSKHYVVPHGYALHPRNVRQFYLHGKHNENRRRDILSRKPPNR